MKKGELTTTEIITLVLTIAGFIIVLLFLALLYDDGQQGDAELCRLSVLTRATTPDEISASVPLKCTTGKICITKGEKCTQFIGEKGVREVKLTGDNDKDLIEKTLANNLYDCWNVMGQGKLDLFAKAGQSIIGSRGQPTCVICSRVAFADDVDQNLLNDVDVDLYMQRTNVPGTSLKYSYVLSGGQDTFYDADKDKIQKAISELKENENVDFSDTNDRQVAFVFSQVKTEKTADVLRNFGISSAIGVGLVSRTPLVGGVLASPVGLIISGTAVTTGAIGVGVNNYLGQLSAATYCGEFTTSVSDQKSGCSLVQAVPYSVQDINNMCPGSIQGRP